MRDADHTHFQTAKRTNAALPLDGGRGVSATQPVTEAQPLGARWWSRSGHVGYGPYAVSCAEPDASTGCIIYLIESHAHRNRTIIRYQRNIHDRTATRPATGTTHFSFVVRVIIGSCVGDNLASAESRFSPRVLGKRESRYAAGPAGGLVAPLADPPTTDTFAVYFGHSSRARTAPASRKLVAALN